MRKARGRTSYGSPKVPETLASRDSRSLQTLCCINPIRLPKETINGNPSVSIHSADLNRIGTRLNGLEMDDKKIAPKNRIAGKKPSSHDRAEPNCGPQGQSAGDAVSARLRQPDRRGIAEDTPPLRSHPHRAQAASAASSGRSPNPTPLGGARQPSAIGSGGAEPLISLVMRSCARCNSTGP